MAIAGLTEFATDLPALPRRISYQRTHYSRWLTHPRALAHVALRFREAYGW